MKKTVSINETKFISPQLVSFTQALNKMSRKGEVTDDEDVKKEHCRIHQIPPKRGTYKSKYEQILYVTGYILAKIPF